MPPVLKMLYIEASLIDMLCPSTIPQLKRLATAPATWAAATEVPVRVVIGMDSPFLYPMDGPLTSTPGAVKSGLINYQFAFWGSSGKILPRQDSSGGNTSQKSSVSVGISRGHKSKRIVRFQRLVNLFPNVFCAIGCPAGIIAVGYAVRKIVFIIWKTLIPNTDNSGSSILIAKGRRCVSR